MARGHIRQRANGTWAAVVELPRDPLTGRRRSKWLSGPTRKAVQQKLTRTLAELDAGSYLDPGRQTVAEFLARWLRDYAEVRLRPSSVETYRNLLTTHALPALGRLQLAALRPQHLQDLYRAVRAPSYRGGHPLAPASAVLLHSILHRALFHAVRWQLLAHNPADHLEPPRAERAERPALELPDMARLLQAAEGTWLHLPILLAVGTGMCRGEVLGLRWQDVQVKGGVLLIRQQIVRTAGETAFGPLKRPSRKRNISVPELLLAAFEQRRALQVSLARDLGSIYCDHGLVICRTDGRPYNPDSLTGAFRRLADQVGLPVVFHDLRHSHATLLLMLGIHAKIVQERLGHHDLSQTMDTYTHVLPSMQTETAELVDRALRGVLEGPRGQSVCTEPLKPLAAGTNPHPLA